jgi:hypothetical protein
MKINHLSRLFCPSVLATALDSALVLTVSSPTLPTRATQTDTPWKSILVATTGAAALIDAATLRFGDVTRVDLPWPTASEVAAVPVPPALGAPSIPPPPLIQAAGDAEQGALVVTDPLLPAQVSSFCI